MDNVPRLSAIRRAASRSSYNRDEWPLRWIGFLPVVTGTGCRFMGRDHLIVLVCSDTVALNCQRCLPADGGEGMEFDGRRGWARQVVQLLSELPESHAEALRVLYFGQGCWEGTGDRADMMQRAGFRAAAAAGLVQLGRLLQAGQVSAPGRSGGSSGQSMPVSAASYADLLEALFARFEDQHEFAVIEQVAASCCDELVGEVRHGARLEGVERLARERLDALPQSRRPGRFGVGGGSWPGRGPGVG